MRGGAGADTFKFREGHDNDVTKDFVIGTDVLFFSEATDAQDAFLNWTVVGQDSVPLDYDYGNSVAIQFAGEFEAFSDSFLFVVA